MYDCTVRCCDKTSVRLQYDCSTTYKEVDRSLLLLLLFNFLVPSVV